MKSGENIWVNSVENPFETHIARLMAILQLCRSKTDSLFFFSSRRRHTRCLSDWSSDVCSSDLHRSHNRERYAPWDTRADQCREIGRASCRERVSSSVVGVSLKKKIAAYEWP